MKTLLLSAFISGAGLLLSLEAHAQGVSRYDLIQGLARPGAVTSGPASYGAGQLDRLQPLNVAEDDFSLSRKQEREALSGLIAAFDPPRVDVEIRFAFGSTDLDPAAFANLNEVSHALLSPALVSTKILIAGHTDSVGGVEYNINLSLRRAIAVRQYLVETYGIPHERLVVTGFGFERPKDFLDPESAINRRVEFINLTGLVQ